MVKNQILRMHIVIYILLFVFIFSSSAFGDVLFSDNFDSQADWSPTQLAASIDDGTCYVGDCNIPTGYAGWRVGGSPVTPVGNNTLNISSENARGGSGKALTIWMESVDGYVNDGLLDIALDSGGYDEIYIRFYLKFQSTWQWQTASTGEKFLHVTHFDPALGSTRYDFFDLSQNKPRYVFQLDQYNGGNSDIAAYNMHSKLGASTTTDIGYFPPSGSYNGGGTDFYDADWPLTSGGMIGDGEWHCWEFRLKMNTADGVADGEQTVWMDGVKIRETTTIDWVTGEDPADRGWNYVWLGGNVHNDFSGDRADEQWYAIDDVVVSTEYIGLLDTVSVDIIPAQNLIIEDN